MSERFLSASALTPPARFKPGLYLAGVCVAVGLTFVAPGCVALALPSMACSLALFGGIGGICRWGRLSSEQRSCTLLLLVIGVPLLRVMGAVCL